MSEYQHIMPSGSGNHLIRWGKLRETDCADTETMLRIIQSVPSPKAEPIKQWLAKVGAREIEEVTWPIPVDAPAALPVKPAANAPAVAWAEYFEAMAALYRRAEAIETTLADHGAQLEELHSRMEGAEEGLRMLLEHLGPATLSPEHQSTLKAQAKRLHEAGGFAYATIYYDLAQSFHVGKVEQIPDEQWPDVVRWFQQRLQAAEKRRRP